MYLAGEYVLQRGVDRTTDFNLGLRLHLSFLGGGLLLIYQDDQDFYNEYFGQDDDIYLQYDDACKRIVEINLLFLLYLFRGSVLYFEEEDQGSVHDDGTRRGRGYDWTPDYFFRGIYDFTCARGLIE